MSDLKLFKNTDSLLNKSRKRIKKVLEKYPNLNENGFDYGYNRGDREEELLDEHSVNAFLLCEQWLKIVDYNKTFNKNHTSYGYKHLVENWTKFYISNGIFIVAAFANKIAVERIHDSFNCHLKISKKSVKMFYNYMNLIPLPESIPKPIYLFTPDYFFEKNKKSDN